jgi:hypothetical protein
LLALAAASVAVFVFSTGRSLGRAEGTLLALAYALFFWHACISY